MKKSLTILALTVLPFAECFSQELPLLNEKQGTFEILSRTNYNSSDCGFTKTEITANLQKITDCYQHRAQKSHS